MTTNAATGSRFQKLADFKASYCPSHVYKWRSTRTGLQAVLIDHETPTVSGYFALATEIDNDSGCPHTLEHLCFMGSRKYPYKGLLDVLGSRMFSNTNAWTATDSTVYTLVTAGWEGFQTLLPVYLDHVFNPTLTDSACYTEVYHIDGHAREKGVVFSEMQGVENTPDDLASVKARKLMYPSSSGYWAETGGLTENLRTLTNKQIRKFHRDLYRADNACIVVTGRVDPSEFLAALEEYDATLPDEQPGKFKRPFVDTPESLPSLNSSIVDHVEFPDKDMSAGMLLMSFQGPKYTSFLEGLAIHMAATYLTDSELAPLQKELVEIPDPLATNIDFYTDDFINIGVNYYFQNVPTPKIESLIGRFLGIVREQIDNSKFDLVRMRLCLERERLQFTLNAEQKVSVLADAAIVDFLYGTNKDGRTLTEALKDITEYDTLLQWTEDDWKNFMRKWILDNPYVAIVARPSVNRYKEIKHANKERRQELIERLGERGLADLAEKLRDATRENEKPVPEDILGQFKPPSLDKIQFIHTYSGKAGYSRQDTIAGDTDEIAQKLVDREVSKTGNDIPLYIHFEHMDTNFVSIYLTMSSALIPANLIKVLNLYLVNLFVSGIELEDGTMLKYDEVIRQMQTDVLDNSSGIGFEGDLNELCTISLRIVPSKYKLAIGWLERLIWNIRYDPTRLLVSVEKFLNALPEYKREGDYVVTSALNRVLRVPSSAVLALDDLAQEDNFKDLRQKLHETPQDIISDLNSLRDHLFTPENVRVIVLADIEKLQQSAPLVESWRTFSKKLSSSSSSSFSSYNSDMVEIPRAIDLLVDKGKSIGGQAFIMPVPATDSSYIRIVTTAPSDYNDSDLPLLKVANESLHVTEGPFWRAIRGPGLAYGAHIDSDTDAGLLGLSLYRASDPRGAIEAARQLISDFINGRQHLSEEVVRGAISSIVNRIAEYEDSAVHAAKAKYADNALKVRGPDFKHKFMSQIQKVGPSQVQHAFATFHANLFDPTRSEAFVACNPAEVDRLSTLLTEMGYEVHINPFNTEIDHPEEEVNELHNRSDGEGEEYTTDEDEDEK